MDAIEFNCLIVIGGYLYVDEILEHKKYKHYCLEDVKRIVKESEKQRFSLCQEDYSGRYKIRATQGHTLTVWY